MTTQDFVRLIEDFLNGDVDVSRFCDLYEAGYNFNFEKDKESFAANEELRALLKLVSYYSPYPDELATIPNYKSEQDIRLAATRSLHALREIQGNDSKGS